MCSIWRISCASAQAVSPSVKPGLCFSVASLSTQSQKNHTNHTKTHNSPPSGLTVNCKATQKYKPGFSRRCGVVFISLMTLRPLCLLTHTFTLRQLAQSPITLVTLNAENRWMDVSFAHPSMDSWSFFMLKSVILQAGIELPSGSRLSPVGPIWWRPLRGEWAASIRCISKSAALNTGGAEAVERKLAIHWSGFYHFV